MNDENLLIKKLEDLELMIQEQNLHQKEMLNLQETSKYLDISQSHLYKLTSMREIPHFCPNGKKLYFKRSELDQWLQRNKKNSREELASQASSYNFKKRTL